MRARISGLALAVMMLQVGACTDSDSQQIATHVPTATNMPQAASTESNEFKKVITSDWMIAESIESLIDGSGTIVIGTVVASTEVINLARDEKDPRNPDPHVLILGQVYEIRVDRYLKGTGDPILNVVQPEGFVYSDRETVSLPDDASDIASTKAENAEQHVEMRLESQYLFFLDDLGSGFDPANGYMTGTVGLPWRFLLPATELGMAQPESPSFEANDRFPPVSVEALIEEVEILLRLDAVGTPSAEQTEATTEPTETSSP